MSGRIHSVSMPSGDKVLSPSGQLVADVLVVGGGVMGLWGAVKAVDAGLSVVLVERGQIGGGASGGPLGAMFPWMPDRWDAKKQYQYDALATLGGELERLQAETGLSAGFRRSGRIIALPKPHLKTIALRHQADALLNWHQGDNRFFWHVSDAPPVADYIAPEFAAGGYVHDTLAARLEPRALVALLRAWLERQPGVRILEHAALADLDAAKGRANVFCRDAPLSLGNGAECRHGESRIAFSHAIIAAGVESFPILQALMPPMPVPLGQGIKGQAAMLKADLDPALPMAFLDGLYVVVHENGHVAVGSTSENSYADPASTDGLLDAVIERARALAPALGDCPVIARWAGLRPKAIGRDPLIGPLPGHENIIALTGGFKISFGMAHRLAASAVDYALGRDPTHTDNGGLPENFTLAGQIAQVPLLV